MREIFLDFDNTIYSSTKAMTRLYNKIYNDNANHRELTTWNAKNFKYIRNSEQIERLFMDEEMYREDEFYDGAVDFIRENADRVTIVTVGRGLNLLHKIKLKNKLFPKVKFIGLENNDIYILSKGLINMSGGVFVDDKGSYLDQSNADLKVLFDPVGYEWNQEYKGLRVKSWSELIKILEDEGE